MDFIYVHLLKNVQYTEQYRNAFRTLLIYRVLSLLTHFDDKI